MRARLPIGDWLWGNCLEYCRKNIRISGSCSAVRQEKKCYTSIIFSTDQDLSEMKGSVQWGCKSPFRPEHKRKKWFVDVSVMEMEKRDYRLDEMELRYERFRSGGKGGQNVNKVETGLRLIHIPTGISVTSISERSQYLNKKDALEKLKVIFMQKEAEENKMQAYNAWREHYRIVRGKPVRVYRGIIFTLQKKGIFDEL